MKIALLTDGMFPFVVGGMQKHSFYLAKYLARAGVHVALYCALPDDLPSRDELNALFTPKEQPFIALNIVKQRNRFRFPGHYILESYLTSVRIWEAVQENLDVDFIYAQGFAGWKALMEKAWMEKVTGRRLPPIGVNFHGFEMWQMPATQRGRMEQWLLRPFVHWNVRMADVVLLLGERLNSIVESITRKQKRKLTSPNGITKAWLAADIASGKGPIRFAFLGRYERRKGIEELHATIQQLDPVSEFHLDIIGPIPTHLRIPSEKVTYWGMIKDEVQIRSILRSADVLVCPSYAEGMPTVILEAMASGMAIIATDVGAVADLVTPENGWIVSPGRSLSLQRAMQAAIDAPATALHEKMKASQAKARQEYLWEHVARKTKSNIQSVI